MSEGGTSSGPLPSRRVRTPWSKSTRTPSRSQNILYWEEDDASESVVAVSAEEARKKPVSCFCFLFLSVGDLPDRFMASLVAAALARAFCFW